MDLGMRAAAWRGQRLVVDAAALADVVDAIAGSDPVAIDTEFVRERTYYPKLCLIQVAADGWVACIDCLAEVDHAPLFGTLTRAGSQWVLHSARQDLEVVWHRARASPSRLIDTQIAAALLGFPPQLGLQDLLTELLGVNLDKAHTRTDWSKRPLPPAALQYALDDVRFLLPAWRELRRRLVDRGRLDWFEEDCANLLSQPLEGEPLSIFLRLKGLAGLSFDQRCAAYALVQWREQRARAANRPRRWILADDQLVRISRALPRDSAALNAVPGLARGFVSRWSEGVTAVLADRRSEPVRSRVSAAGLDREPDRAALKALKAEVKARAAALGIQPEVIASQRDLIAAAAGQPPPALASGWRAAVIGQDSR